MARRFAARTDDARRALLRQHPPRLRASRRQSPIADAKLKFTFPAWKEGAVEPATYRLLVRKWDVKPSPEHVKEMAIPEGYSIRGVLNDRKTLFITSHQKGHGLFSTPKLARPRTVHSSRRESSFPAFRRLLMDEPSRTARIEWTGKPWTWRCASSLGLKDSKEWHD